MDKIKRIFRDTPMPGSKPAEPGGRTAVGNSSSSAAGNALWSPARASGSAARNQVAASEVNIGSVRESRKSPTPTSPVIAPAAIAPAAVAIDDANRLPDVGEVYASVTRLISSWGNGSAGHGKLANLNAFCSLGLKDGKSAQEAKFSVEQYLNLAAMLAFSESAADVRGTLALQSPERGRILLSAMQEFVIACVGNNEEALEDVSSTENIFGFCHAFNKLDQASGASSHGPKRHLDCPDLRLAYQWSSTVDEVVQAVMNVLLQSVEYDDAALWNDWDDEDDSDHSVNQDPVMDDPHDPTA